jgi:FkbM family methyltransferase
LNNLKQILTDYFGLVKLIGFIKGSKWLLGVILNLKTCIKERNLQAADRFVGPGFIIAKKKNTIIKFFGDSIISGIREIWIREVYTGEGFLSLKEKTFVVDLGANVGNFTLLALAMNDENNVLAVEPNSELNKIFRYQIQINGWEKRVNLNRFFLGNVTAIQEQMVHSKENKGATWVTPKEFIEKNKISKINFLKCDIEGSEFDLIKGDAELFRISDQVAVEVHDFGGDRNDFTNKLKKLGFIIGPIKYDPGSCIIQAKRNQLKNTTESNSNH